MLATLRLMTTALLVLTTANSSQAQENAMKIIQKSDELMRGKTLAGKYTMTIIRPDWQRSMAFQFWSEGTEKSFIQMLAPARDKNVTFLKIKREMWNYIPKINRVIKIPPSMMLQSWMGSDFTNDDLVKESSIIEDYDHKLLRKEQYEGAATYVVELKPKPDAAVVWDKVVEWIRVTDYIPLKAEYYNERGERIRTMVFSDITTFGKRVIPARFEMLEDKKPGRKTVMLLEDAVFDAPIKKSVFTKQNLRKSR